MSTTNAADKTNTSANAKREGSIPRLTERSSALHAEEFPAPRMNNTIRKKLAERLFLTESDLPYTELEEASRKIFRAIVERQDRLAESLLLKLNDIEYRLDTLEQAIHPEE